MAIRNKHESPEHTPVTTLELTESGTFYSSPGKPFCHRLPVVVCKFNLESWIFGSFHNRNKQ